MKKTLFITVITLTEIFLSCAPAAAQERPPVTLTDGPYLFRHDSAIKALWIKNSMVKEKTLTVENFDETARKFKLKFSFNDIAGVGPGNPDFDQRYNDVDCVAVITDLHGEYKKFARLLKGNGVTDKDLNWSFGTGHLVVLGDIFDRGGSVTDILWSVFALERQAEASGGKVHVLLGNHEFMELGGDGSFANEKYLRLQNVLGMPYPELYSDKSILGRWLRSKPVVITINKMIFTHGGLSEELVRKGLTISVINTIYYDLLNGKKVPATELENAAFLQGSEDSPLWYRGYFTDRSFTTARLMSVLGFYGMEKIIVGHTTFDEMISLYGSRLIGADAGIMNRSSGEILIYKEGVFYRGSKSGRRFWFAYQAT